MTDGKTIAQRKAEYEQSALKQLMDANGHNICERCYCCDASWESAPCFQCGGFDEDEDDDFYMPCPACGGEGETFWIECLGRCDEQGNHKASTGAIALSGEPISLQGRDPQESATADKS